MAPAHPDSEPLHEFFLAAFADLSDSLGEDGMKAVHVVQACCKTLACTWPDHQLHAQAAHAREKAATATCTPVPTPRLPVKSLRASASARRSS